jgi:hypothetical protein
VGSKHKGPAGHRFWYPRRWLTDNTNDPSVHLLVLGSRQDADADRPSAELLHSKGRRSVFGICSRNPTTNGAELT